MSISIQGNWTIEVIGKNPQALPQRFIISGATIGNGTYSGFLGANPVQVQGTNWLLNIQANESYELDGKWIDSDIVAGQVQKIGNLNVFQINSEDLIQDNSYDDLVLRLSQPAQVIVQPPPVVPGPVQPPIIPDPVIPPPIPPKPEPPKQIPVGKVYTKLTDGDILPRQEIKTTYGIFLDYTGSATGNLVTFYTCSADTGSYKKSVYNSQCFTCSSSPQFDIAYGHDGGSGSRDLGGQDWFTPSNAVYGQFRNLCLNPGQRRFNFGSNEIFHFYAINVHRDRMGDRLDEGNIELNLAQLSGSGFTNRNVHTGSNVKLSGTGKVIRLIDDSKLNLETLSTAAYSGLYRDISGSMCHISSQAGKVFYIVSGSLEDGVYNSTQPHVYGLLYPQQGIIILDAEKLDQSASFLTTTGSDVAGDNSMKLFTSISGSALLTDTSGDYLGFQARRLKYNYLEQYFIRVKNQDYNFTNNPTYVTGSEGDIITDFYNNPQLYITSVGLYNENHELLAVGKISKPIYKNYTEEALLEINLKY